MSATHFLNWMPVPRTILSIQGVPTTLHCHACALMRLGQTHHSPFYHLSSFGGINSILHLPPFLTHDLITWKRNKFSFTAASPESATMEASQVVHLFFPHAWMFGLFLCCAPSSTKPMRLTNFTNISAALKILRRQDNFPISTVKPVVIDEFPSKHTEGSAFFVVAVSPGRPGRASNASSTSTSKVNLIYGNTSLDSATSQLGRDVSFEYFRPILPDSP